MKARILFIPIFGLLAGRGLANPGGGDVPFDFEFTALGGDIPALDLEGNDDGISAFPLFMDDPSITQIFSLELELTGLTHTEPDDLDVYLMDPFGETVQVFADRGDALPVINITLIFNDDLGTSLLPDEGQMESGTYDIEHPGGLANFNKQSGGTDAWILLFIDDSPGDSGFLESWTLRGSGVPEPVTLSLLAVGAVAILRRRRA